MRPLWKIVTGTMIVMALALQVGSALAVEPTVKGVVRTVDDNGMDCPGAGYSSIGAALADSAPGDTVSVCAGIYTEQLVISSKSNLKLIGIGSPIIVAPPVANGAIVLVENSNDVTIQGLVVDGGYRFSLASTEMTGISFRNSSGTISNNIISRIRRQALDPLGSFPQGVGIRVYDRHWAAATPAPIKILNNTITDIQFAGIWVESPMPEPYAHHPGAYVPTISRNRIQTLADGNGSDFTSGIRLEWVAGGSVSNNVIVANSGFGGPGSIGFGIYLYNPSHLKIATNTIKAFAVSIYVYTYAAYLVDANTISNNQLIDAVFGGINFGNGQGGTQTKNNMIQKNKIIVKIPPGDKGIVFYTGSADDDKASGNKITGNTIQGYSTPIVIDWDDGVSISGNKVSPYAPPGA